MRRSHVLSGAVGALAILFLMGAFGSWTTAFDASPGNVSVSQLDNEQRNHRQAVRERGAVEHDWGTSAFETGYSDTGQHIPGSAIPFWQDDEPTARRVPDNSGYQDGAIGSPSALGPDDAGRIWVETDENNQMYAWNGTAMEALSAMPNFSWDFASSVDSTIIPTGSVGTMTSWVGGAGPAGQASVVIPGEGRWIAGCFAKVVVANTSGNNRDVRVDLVVNNPISTNAVRDSAEMPVRQNDSKEITLMTLGIFAVSTADVYRCDIEAESDHASAVTFGGKANALTANGAANTTSTVIAFLIPTAS